MLWSTSRLFRNKRFILQRIEEECWFLYFSPGSHDEQLIFMYISWVWGYYRPIVFIFKEVFLFLKKYLDLAKRNISNVSFSVIHSMTEFSFSARSTAFSFRKKSSSRKNQVIKLPESQKFWYPVYFKRSWSGAQSPYNCRRLNVRNFNFMFFY